MRKLGAWSKRTIGLGFVGLRFIALAVVVVTFTWQSSAYGLSPAQRRTYANQGIHFIDEYCSTIEGAGSVDTSAAQEANIRATIGIAKTYDMGNGGRRLALIGLMAGLTESHFKNYANNGTFVNKSGTQPYIGSELRSISFSFPHDAVGNDNDSVGIMQQRPSTGWSTFGNGFSRDIIGQLMNPAYAAQAFFGTPPGAQLPEGLAQPGALKKGVQNKANWQTRDPGEIAQSVQGSAFPDRYNQHKSEALDLLDQFWDSSPAVPLPVSVTGGEAPASSADTCPAFTGDLFETIQAYAWDNHHKAPNFSDAKEEYQQATTAAKNRGEYVGGCVYGADGHVDCRYGIDCGAFVTRVMRDSGADPNYNFKDKVGGRPGNTSSQQAYMEANLGTKYQKMVGVNGTDDLPTDNNEVYIAIKSWTYDDESGHTYIYLGDGIEGWGGNSASASIGPGSWRAPMADNAYSFTDFSWYKLLGSGGV